MAQEFLYSYQVPGSAPTSGETVPYKSGLLEEDEDILLMPSPDLDTIKKIFQNSVNEYGTEPFLGTRTVEESKDEAPQYGKYEWKTYDDIYIDCENLAKYIIGNKLFCDQKDQMRELKLVGVYGKNCEQWTVIDLACVLSNVATVTLYDTLGADSSEYIIKQCELKTVFTSADHIQDLVDIKNEKGADHLDTIVSFTEISAEDRKKCKGSSINLFSLDELIFAGSKLSVGLEDAHNQDVFTICYTSGTTGNPKGVMLSHGCITSMCAGLDRSPVKLKSSDVHLSYLPLAHIMERIVFMGLMANGARIGYYQGDVLKLVEDLAALRPTVFVSVPRLYTKLYDRIQGVIKDATGLKAKLLRAGINSKLARLRRNGNVKHCLYDKLIFNKMKARLGGRVRICITGSAPISKDILDFLKICFCCPILEGYGQTELTGANTVGLPGDPVTGHVGGVFPSFLMKLQDVPEMDYKSTDRKDGVLYPRGEVCFRGGGAMLGYFKEPEKTSETIDKDGWVHTGDIGELQPNGSLRIIDRKKNIFKLSQGEYIAAEKLELIYAKSPLIQQIFVYGDSLQSFLVAIIVPDKEYVEKNENPSNYKSYISSSEYTDQINKWFKECREEHKLNGLEIPKKLHITDQEFSLETGTLTPTFKLIRASAKKLYYKEIKEMYGGAKLQGE